MNQILFFSIITMLIVHTISAEDTEIENMAETREADSIYDDITNENVDTESRAADGDEISSVERTNVDNDFSTSEENVRSADELTDSKDSGFNVVDQELRRDDAELETDKLEDNVFERAESKLDELHNNSDMECIECRNDEIKAEYDDMERYIPEERTTIEVDDLKTTNVLRSANDEEPFTEKVVDDAASYEEFQPTLKLQSTRRMLSPFGPYVDSVVRAAVAPRDILESVPQNWNRQYPNYDSYNNYKKFILNFPQIPSIYNYNNPYARFGFLNHIPGQEYSLGNGYQETRPDDRNTYQLNQGITHSHVTNIYRPLTKDILLQNGFHTHTEPQWYNPFETRYTNLGFGVI